MDYIELEEIYWATNQCVRSGTLYEDNPVLKIGDEGRQR